MNVLSPNHSIVNLELDLIVVQEIKNLWVGMAANYMWMWMVLPKLLAMFLNPFSSPLIKLSGMLDGRTVQAI